MSESNKTITMASVAVVLLILAILAHPKSPYAVPEGEVGKPLFPTLTDTHAAKRMEIATFDKTTQTVSNFEVAFVNGKWCVPSHDDYPANAEKHLENAASQLVNLDVLEVVSDSQASHETYGVVEPDSTKLKSPAFGVGKLVTVKDKEGKDLARLIIGDEDKPLGEAESSNVRFVRKAGEDRVYKVKLAADLFSSNFQDWIDPDLLGIKQHWDATKLLIRDFDFAEEGDRIAIGRKDDLSLQFEDPKMAWVIKQLTEYKGNKPAEVKLAADEELDSAKVDEAKKNLSGIKIVDVRRKLPAYAENLKKGKLYPDNRETQAALAQRGFFVFPQDKPTDILSEGDDVTVGMKDGVEYTVHFGTVKHSLHDKDADKDKKSAAKVAGDDKHISSDRYVFATARFNEDLLTKPDLKPLPESKKPADKKPADGKTDEKQPEGAKPEGKAGAVKSPETKAPDSKTPDTKAPETKTPQGKAPEIKAPDGKTPDNKAPASKPEDTKKSAATSRPDMLLALADQPAPMPPAKAPADTKAADAKATDAKATDAKKPDAAAKTPAAAAPDNKGTEQKAPESGPPAKPADDKSPAPPKATADDVKKTDADKKPVSDIKRADEEKALDDLRKQIEAENKQKTDEYDAAVKRGKDHAKELNDRFADWYYLISEDDYKKVHVTRADLIKKKAPPEGAAAPGLGPVPTDPFQKGHGAIPEEK